MVTSTEANSLYSSLREKIVEHLFLGQVLRELWQAGVYTTEVSRAESDSFGYDLVIECGRIVRHIQLKSKSDHRPAKVSVAKSLADKPSGCVVAIILDENLSLKSFYWFGDVPGKPLPAIGSFSSTKRIRRDKEGKRPPRPNHVDVPIKNLTLIKSLPELVIKLFGPIAEHKGSC
jgi:hypothetical protein